MTKTHTSGPWNVGITRHDGIEITAGARVIAKTIHTCAISKANARVMAAAPELLESLMAILDGGISDPEQVAKAHAIIAKAKGRA